VTVAVFALCSARGSPGVTTAALAFTLSWPGRCVLVECDPAGGTILPGYLQGALGDERSIRELAVAELRGEDMRTQWWSQLVDLHAPHRQRLLLPGVGDPVQAGALRPLWDRFAEFFAELEHPDGYDVIADCGRLVAPNSPLPLLSAADLVLLTLRPTLAGMSAAIPAIRTLRHLLTGQAGGHDRLRLLLTGPGDHSPRTVAHELDTPVATVLPDDPRSAAVLSFGGTLRSRARLLQAAADAHRDLTGLVRRGHVDADRPGARPDAETAIHGG
jgi:hypothetical protein